MLSFHIVTLFPDACDAYLNASIIGRARKDKKITVSYQNPRDFVDLPRGKAGNTWAYRKVDDKPYGGGPGMVITAMPIVKAVTKALRRSKQKAVSRKQVILWFNPSAKQFTNKDADTLTKYDNIVLVCGRYEGIDERAKKILKTLAASSPGRRLRVKEFAVGEAVYTGGEVPALAIVDAVTRRIPGVLGKDASVEERRIASSAVYTRPETILYKKKRYRVPKILQTGHHVRINAWRKKR